MYRSLKVQIVALAFISVCLLGASANAACDGNGLGAILHRQSWQASDVFQSGSLLRIDNSENDGIVGMWHVTLTAQGNEIGPPDGTPLDNALVTWHSDGTELMNSARPPQMGTSAWAFGKKREKPTG